MKKIKIELCNYSLESELPFKFTEKRFEKYKLLIKSFEKKANGYMLDETSKFHFIVNSIRISFEGCIPIEEGKKMFEELINNIK